LESLHIKTTPGNRIVEITFDWPDPELAARFANLLASAFIAQTFEARWNSSQSTGEWLISQLETTRTRLESLEAELQAYSQSSGLLFTAEKDNVADERLRQIQAELSRAQADRAIRESSYKLSQGSPDALPEVQDSTRMKEHNARLTDMRRELAELSLTRTPAHYQVIRLKAQIDEQERAMSRDRSDILSRIKNEFDRAVEREDLLKGAYEAQGKVVADQAGRRAHYNVLMREVETSRRIYDGMLERVRDASVAATIRASNIRVVDPATPQTRPAKPKLFLNAVGGCFSGLLLAFAYIIFGERANQAFRSAEDMPRLLGTRGLGVIPSGRRLIGRRGERLKLAVSVLPNLRRSDNGDRPESLDLVAWQERPSTFAESFRTVWASVMFNAGSANRPAVLVLTSPAPREGKTTVSTNLAIALAELGMRVVLLDCDLRQPRLHKVFGVSNSWGITSLVNGDIALSDCPLEALTRSTEVPCLYVTTSGPGTATVSGVLMSTRFRELVTRLRKEFDAVLIDTPPVIEFADARIASRSADGVILVIRANQTNRADALTAAQLLTDDGIRIIGSVLNDWGPKTAGYRYKYGHFSS
jgi:capsular exopolysaccharide synthesis family protein